MPSVSLLEMWTLPDVGPKLGIMSNVNVYKPVCAVTFIEQPVEKIRQYIKIKVLY